MTRPSRHPRIRPYKGPSGGYGSLKSVAEILLREGVPIEGAEVVSHQNKPGGFMCVSCAWAKPTHPHPAEFCENGAKATACAGVPGRSVRSPFGRRLTYGLVRCCS
jgi:hypothetical protein